MYSIIMNCFEASLSDLRELVIYNLKSDDEAKKLIDSMELIKGCLTAFGEHPFGAAAACPWPQLSSVTLYVSGCDIVISGIDGAVTSLSLSTPSCDSIRSSNVEYMHQVFKVLNSSNVCPKLRALKITTCPLELHKVSSSVLAYLLAYFTKRQLEVESGTPFLLSLSLSAPCGFRKNSPPHLPKLIDKLYVLFVKTIRMKMRFISRDQMRCLLQKIFDQGHGLEVAFSTPLTFIIAIVKIHYLYFRN